MYPHLKREVWGNQIFIRRDRRGDRYEHRISGNIGRENQRDAFENMLEA